MIEKVMHIHYMTKGYKNTLFKIACNQTFYPLEVGAMYFKISVPF